MADPALTVAEFIELPVVRAALPELVAGSGGLAAEVRWVHSLDVPDVANLLRGGEMILTTGVSVGPDAAAQRRFVRDLVAEGAVGVAVELGFAWHRDAQAAGGRSREPGLPMVALRRGVRFVEVSQAVNGSLLNSGYALARRGEELHRNLDRIVLEGAGSEAALTEVRGRYQTPSCSRMPGESWSHTARPQNPKLRSSTPGRSQVVGPGCQRGRRRGGDAGHGQKQDLGPRDRDPGRLGTRSVHRDRNGKGRGCGRVRTDEGREEAELRARSRGNLMFELAGGLIDPLTATRRASTLGFPRRHGELVPLAAVWRPGAAETEAGFDQAWASLIAPIRSACRNLTVPLSRIARQLHARGARPGIEGFRARRPRLQAAAGQALRDGSAPA